MTDERMFTVPEVARFLGITPQAVRQRIVEGRLRASKVRVKGIAREYRISGEAIQEHYDLCDADMRRLTSETVRYRVGFMGWGHGLPPSQTTNRSTPATTGQWLRQRGCWQFSLASEKRTLTWKSGCQSISRRSLTKPSSTPTRLTAPSSGWHLNGQRL